MVVVTMMMTMRVAPGTRRRACFSRTDRLWCLPCGLHSSGSLGSLGFRDDGRAAFGCGRFGSTADTRQHDHERRSEENGRSKFHGRFLTVEDETLCDQLGYSNAVRCRCML